MAFSRRWEVTINRNGFRLNGVTRWAVELEAQPTVKLPRMLSGFGRILRIHRGLIDLRAPR
jgi:hypothetical protein